MIKELKITDAKYVSEYRLELRFSDGNNVIVDFKPFLDSSSHPEIQKYLDKELFKSFAVVDGELDWNDFDLVFPINDLYTNSILKFTSSMRAS